MDPVTTQPGAPTTRPGTAPAAPPPTAEAEASNALSSDFETFLRMLTVQVQNQDPMNPVDSTEYATQLATFSSVEQQVRTNELLVAMSERLGVGSLQDMGAWIGMEGLVRAPARFEGQPVTARPDLHPEADRGTIVIRTADGTALERYPLESPGEAFVWDGLDATGAEHPSGIYRIEIESYADGVLIDSQLAPVYSRIDEVRSADGDTLVRLADGSELPTGLVDGLRSR